MPEVVDHRIDQQADGEVDQEYRVGNLAQTAQRGKALPARNALRTHADDQQQPGQTSQKNAIAPFIDQSANHQCGNQHGPAPGCAALFCCHGPVGHHAQPIGPHEVDGPDVQIRIQIETEERCSSQRHDQRLHASDGPGPPALYCGLAPALDCQLLQTTRTRQKQDRACKQLKVYGHIPDTGGQRLLAHNVLQQQRMGKQLPEVRVRRDGLVIEPGANGCRDDDGHHQRYGIRHNQTHKALADFGPWRIKPGQPLRCQACSRQEATNHQKNLHRHAGVLIEPVQQIRHDRVRHIGHGAIERQVMPDNGRASQAFGAINQSATRVRVV